MKLRLPALAAALLIARTVSGESTPGGPNEPAPDVQAVPNETPDLEWPATLGATGPFGRAVAGQFTEDGIRDVVSLKGSTAVLVYGPAQHEAFHALAGEWQDLEVLARLGPDGQDVLATVGAAGLALHWLPRAAGEFTCADPGGDSWSGTARLRRCDWNGDGWDDLVGLAADRRTVLVKTAIGGGGAPPELADEAGFSVPWDVLEFEPCEFDGVPGLELAAVTEKGLRVYAHDGKQILHVRDWFPGDVMAVIRVKEQPQDRIAWMTRAPNGVDEWLTVVDAGGYEPPLNLGPILPRALVAVDWNGDGADDLAASVASSQQLAVFIQQPPGGTTFALGPGAFGALDLAPAPAAPALENQAWPAAADFDGDGDSDLLMAVEGAGYLRMFTSKAIGEPDQAPRFGAFAFRDPDFSPPPAGGFLLPTTGTNGDTGTLEFDVIAPPVFPEGANGLALTVWRLPSAASPAHAEAVYSATIPVDGGTVWPLRCSIPLAESGYPFAAVFALEMHLSTLSDSAIPLAHPSALGCYGTDFAALQTFAGAVFVEEVALPVVLLDDPPEPGEPPHDTAAVGGVVPQADVPDFGAGEIPRPNAP